MCVCVCVCVLLNRQITCRVTKHTFISQNFY